MKKQYITPAISVVAVETPEMICTSTGFSLYGDEMTDDNYARGITWPPTWDEE